MNGLVARVQSPGHEQRPKTRRAAVACRRCRRLRVKCRYLSTHEPCEQCSHSGHDCVFPQRGEPDYDRAYRHERRRKQQVPNRQTSTSCEPIALPRLNTFSGVNGLLRAESRSSEAVNESHQRSLAPGADLGRGPATPSEGSDWDLLPPFEEVVEGCQVFTTSYFQLGFLPKTNFFEKLHKRKEDISVFLLLCILSISARFTPSLVARYGSGQNATNCFLRSAASMVPAHMYKPSLESMQAFFLMSLAEWGKGEKDRSSTHMGIAVRMAGTLRLHREETYYLPEGAAADKVVESEVIRRTFWMLQNHEDLFSGLHSPSSFSLGDITTLLPCEEQDFAFGIAPFERAALMGTPPAIKHEELTKSPSRSLFATLIQSHNIWGQIARRVAHNEAADQQDSAGQAKASMVLGKEEYLRLSALLKDFEENLPQRHQWSVWNLRGFRAQRLDLAYLSVVMMIRLSTIILRRSHVLGSFKTTTTGSTITASPMMAHARVHGSRSSAVEHETTSVTDELFHNMVILYDQIDAYFSIRSPNEGFPAFVVFCIYICGSLANHLQKSDKVFFTVENAHARATKILESSTKLLSDVQDSWPMARRWSDALLRAYQKQVMTSTTTPTTATAAVGSQHGTVRGTHGDTGGDNRRNGASRDRLPPPPPAVATTTTVIGRSTVPRSGPQSSSIPYQQQQTREDDDLGDDGNYEDYNDDSVLPPSNQTSPSGAVAYSALQQGPSASESLLSRMARGTQTMDNDEARDVVSQHSHDPWNDIFSGVSLTDNFDSELAFYTWPGGEVWEE